MRRLPILLSAAALLLPLALAADELTKTIETDLAALGYQTGPVDGVESVETQIAISQFQADNGLEVTGKPSPQLAGVIKSRLGGGNAVAAAPPMTPEQREAARRAEEQACIQRKIEERQKAEQQKKGFSSLMRAVSRTASRYAGSSDIAADVSEASRTVYDVNATKEDFEQAAKDMGLSQDEIEACRQGS